MYVYYFLVGDIVLVLLTELFVNKHIHLPFWKIVVFTLAIVPVGYFCGKLMRLVEAGTWEGVSYYGALLFAPLPMIAVGLMLKIRPLHTSIMCAPAGCIALIFMKIQCKLTDCCYGRILGYQDNGRPIRFPSQIVEMIVGIVILIILMKLLQSDKYQKGLYAYFLLIYGGTRFFLNLLRDTEPFVLGLSAGCFWSVMACVVGACILYFQSKMNVSADS